MKAWTIVETVSGSVTAKKRKEFAPLLDKMKTGDVLIVTNLDRLGRKRMQLRPRRSRLRRLRRQPNKSLTGRRPVCC